jgi:hypothetical protein
MTATSFDATLMPLPSGSETSGLAASSSIEHGIGGQLRDQQVDIVGSDDRGRFHIDGVSPTRRVIGAATCRVRR